MSIGLLLVIMLMSVILGIILLGGLHVAARKFHEYHKANAKKHQKEEMGNMLGKLTGINREN